MNNDGYSVGNLFANITKKQKITIGVVVAFILVASLLLGFLVNLVREDISAPSDEESSSVANDGASTDGDTQEGGDNNSGEGETPVSTEYNEKHKYTLDDYIPKARFNYITYGDGQDGLREYWVIEENTAIEKGIVVSVESCDVEGNTASANEYLKSLPVDLSEYTIVYQTYSGNLPCDVQ